MKSPTSSIPQLACAAALAALFLLVPGCKRPEPGTYATPDEAVQALNAIIGTRDNPQTEVMFGPGSVDMFRSGDDEADRADAARVKALLNEKVAFEEIDDKTQVALFGERAWPFPIPLVRTGERWRFDTAAGREELLNRRIGFNELATLASMHAYVDAQFEYFAQGHDGNPPAFAQRFRSEEGKRNGLYWPTAEDEDPSPLGDLLAGAAALDSPEPLPFHGYEYRILKAQGKNAPGGERNYVNEKGLMTGGFAAIAWPAKYGNSGVMTFMVSARDIVFQKDLGAETAELAAAITAFDPDSTWDPTGDSIEAVEDDGEETDEPEAETSAAQSPAAVPERSTP
jgi:hypothetical protein